MFKVSAVPPRRSAMLTVFRGATAINDGTTAEPLRPWRRNYGLCRTSTAVAPRLRCDGGRRSAVMTILRDATAINDGTTAIMAVSRRNHGDNGGATAVYAVQAPQWYRASGVTGVLLRLKTRPEMPDPSLTAVLFNLMCCQPSVQHQIYNLVCVCRHIHINSFVSAPLSSTKIAVMK